MIGLDYVNERKVVSEDREAGNSWQLTTREYYATKNKLYQTL